MILSRKSDPCETIPTVCVCPAGSPWHLQTESMDYFMNQNKHESVYISLISQKKIGASGRNQEPQRRLRFPRNGPTQAI